MSDTTATISTLEENHLHHVRKKMKTSPKDSSLNNLSTNPQIIDPEPSCKFFVQRKKRFCKMTVKRGHEYCGEHSLILNIKDNKGENGTGIDRIPCPLDPAHTVYKKNLNKHLKVCNARPKETVEPYIVKDLNRGTGTSEVEDFKLNEVADDVIQEVVQIVNKLYDTHFSPETDMIQELFRNHNILEAELETKTSLETLRQLKQSAALIGLAEEYELLQPNTSYIEFGAGKGQLSYYLAKTVQNLSGSKVFLVDRASPRHKKDNQLEDRELVQRIRADIVDFSIGHLLESSPHCQQVVGVSKHLCGNATDLTLNCILNGNKSDKHSSTCPTTGFLIALCCHHRCNWRDFCGKEFFAKHDIDEKRFCLITKMASWFVCGTGMSRERRKELEERGKDAAIQVQEEMIKYNLPREEREKIGWKCKRILDLARKNFMEKNGYKCSFKYYVPTDLTLENICFVGLLNKEFVS